MVPVAFIVTIIAFGLLRLAPGDPVLTFSGDVRDPEILTAMRPEVLEKLTAPVPLRRLGQPEEIAHAVLFIFENDFFTGRCLEVDGGLRL